jgi:hypothetical protein
MPRRPSSALIAAVLLCLWVAPLTAARSTGSTSLPAWGTEPSPNAGHPRNVLSGVDVLTADDAWSVGHYEAGGFNHPRPLAEHWDGSSWSSVPVAWNQESELFGVAAVSADDVWAVGGYQQGGSALIAHSDGASLTTVPHPNPGAFNRLYAVTAIAANDVWAVGEFTSPISRTLALHWDGSAWTHVPTPTGDGYSHLYGVTAIGPNDVWAVGDDGNTTLSLHWDGTQWSRVTTPSPGFSPTLRAVSAAPDGTLWAVGDIGPTSLTMRWDGDQWNVVPSPNPGSSFLDLNGVASLSANDAWAVGVYDVWGSWKTLTMHWDGSTWSVADSPSPDPSINELNGVAALASTQVWAVGHGGMTGSMALHLSAGTWQRVVSADEGTGDNVLNGLSARTPSDIWAVGHAQTRSLAMHYDGAAWTVVPTPNLDYGLRLEDVVTLGKFDAWAVGWSESGGNLDDVNVAMHWNGKAWTIVPTPQPGGTSYDRLLAIDAAGPNDVWATGVYWDAQGHNHSVILHWNGSSWATVAHNCDTYGGLTGVTVISPTDAWAVGDSETCHYDGTSWTEVPSPQPRIEYSEIGYPLEDVSGATSNDVWAVGSRAIDTGYNVVFDSIAEHWNGTAWSIDYFVPGEFLYGVEAISATNVWAVGTNSYGPLIVHNDGTGWSEVPTPEWGRGGRLAGIDSATNPFVASLAQKRELWAAGNYLPGQGPSRTLIQRAPSPTQGAVVGSTNVAYATISWFGPENGSVETDPFGDYQIGGLTAGTYTFTATNPGCTPASASVTVIAGMTIRQNLTIDCNRAGLGSRRNRGPAKRRSSCAKSPAAARPGHNALCPRAARLHASRRAR